MKSAHPHFILCCNRMQLLHLLLLVAVPGVGLVLMALLLDGGSTLRAAYWGAGLVSLVTLGWVIVVLALSAHTGFHLFEVDPVDGPANPDASCSRAGICKSRSR